MPTVFVFVNLVRRQPFRTAFLLVQGGGHGTRGKAEGVAHAGPVYHPKRKDRHPQGLGSEAETGENDKHNNPAAV